MLSNNSWKGWGVSQIGPLHFQENIPNQDAFTVKTFSWGIIGVVCDGLGSKKHSHIGSQALVDSIHQASKIFDFEKKIELFEPLLYSLWQINIFPFLEENTSSTLLFTIIKNSKVHIGRVGDGAIAVYGQDNHIIEESKDSFTNYTTPFGRETRIEWFIYREEDVDAIVLCSDGISEDIKKDRLLDFFNEYLLDYKGMRPQKRNMIIKGWLKNWPVRGHSDDKTIVAVTKV